MFLEYGLNDRGDLIHVDDVGRGRVALMCPYCAVPLLAKKGQIKAAHFAHDGPTCAASVSGRASLPSFDRFDLELPVKIVTQLRRFSVGHTSGIQYGTLKEYGLIQKTDKGRFELTTRGKIPLGQLHLKLFLEYQEAAFVSRHHELEEKVRGFSVSDVSETSQASEHHICLTDLRLYRAQWRRLLQSTLYFIEVTHASENWPSPLYKIGVTTRDLADRCAEIARDLRPYMGEVSLTPLDTWPHRGSVEFYFKYRYQKQQFRIERLTEYFQFRKLESVLAADLRQISAKTLSPFDQALIDDLPLDIPRVEIQMDQQPGSIPVKE